MFLVGLVRMPTHPPFCCDSGDFGFRILSWIESNGKWQCCWRMVKEDLEFWNCTGSYMVIWDLSIVSHYKSEPDGAKVSLDKSETDGCQ